MYFKFSLVIQLVTECDFRNLVSPEVKYLIFYDVGTSINTHKITDKIKNLLPPPPKKKNNSKSFSGFCTLNLPLKLTLVCV